MCLRRCKFTSFAKPQWIQRLNGPENGLIFFLFSSPGEPIDWKEIPVVTQAWQNQFSLRELNCRCIWGHESHGRLHLGLIIRCMHLGSAGLHGFGQNLDKARNHCGLSFNLLIFHFCPCWVDNARSRMIWEKKERTAFHGSNCGDDALNKGRSFRDEAAREKK